MEFKKSSSKNKFWRKIDRASFGYNFTAILPINLSQTKNNKEYM